MIRKITLLAVFISASLNAQVVPTLLNNLSDGQLYEGYSDMALYNNDMYISNSDSGAIIKVGVDSPDQEPSLVLSNLSFPTGLAVYGTDLYFFQGADQMFTMNSGSLWKLDLTNPAATPIELMGGLSFPTEIEVSGTNVYLSENIITMAGGLDHGQVSLISLAGTPTKTILYDDLFSLDDLELNGNDLYLLEWKESTDQTTIYKLDVTSGTPVTPTVYYNDTEGYYPWRMEIMNNMLYFNLDSSDQTAVMALDLNATNPTATIVVTPFEFNGQGVYVDEIIVTPSNMLYAFGSMFDGTDAYYLLYNADLTSLGTVTNDVRVASAYPNPCVDVLNVSGIETASAFKVYDLSGKQVLSGMTTGTIETAKLVSGVYFISVEGFATLKFIKQ